LKEILMTPERRERLLQRRARLEQHIADPHNTPLAERRAEWTAELKSIEAELAGAPSPSGTIVELPAGNLSAKAN